MSVEVAGLTKIFGKQRAVDNISFSVNKGEVLGFLGPNGAGKSTTMRMISSFLPPSSGTVSVCGFDTLKNPMQVKRSVGYLAENNPLYTEMYVTEFLRFCARVHGLSKPKSRIEEVINLTGLGGERHKKIRQLSKGYRQRTGLAQALLHDPPVLILDEPTSGLDPNQLTGIRTLIKALGKEKTIILSTHIMQEVQAICDRVIIINKGTIVADDRTDALQKSGLENKVFVVEFNERIESGFFETISHSLIVSEQQEKVWRITARQDIREAIFKKAVENNLTVIGLHLEKQSLEDVFRQLTQDNRNPDTENV